MSIQKNIAISGHSLLDCKVTLQCVRSYLLRNYTYAAYFYFSSFSLLSCHTVFSRKILSFTSCITVSFPQHSDEQHYSFSVLTFFWTTLLFVFMYSWPLACKKVHCQSFSFRHFAFNFSLAIFITKLWNKNCLKYQHSYLHIFICVALT